MISNSTIPDNSTAGEKEQSIQTEPGTHVEVHPLGSRARVLLTSVFGPYAQDDQFGSREINPMELYHNQVTRVQGPFSLRMFHRSWGLMMIQSNIKAPCTLLDFPTHDRLIDELKNNEYDVVGISSILVNLRKVQEICQLVRKYQPGAQIVIGGHIANMPDLKDRVDADHIVQGEGIRWFRNYLKEDTHQPVNHPLITSGIGARCLGMNVKEKPSDVAATLIPSVGCPLGCNFCSTSAMFGGKGKFLNFYTTGDDLFEIMVQLEMRMNVSSFFVMDENFLFHKKRALRLLELIEEHNKSWSIYVFASANILRMYSMDQLIRLGISWVWMGLEGESSQYNKLKGIDAHELVKELQDNGVRVLGSTIIGFDEHNSENIDDVIDYAVSYDTDFHQFMLYTPLPGTELHKEMSLQGVIKSDDEYDIVNMHGQHSFNYNHSQIKNGEETEMVTRAFQKDFEINGPSVVRIVRTTLAGWKKHKSHPDPRIRKRYEFDARGLGTSYSAMVAACLHYFEKDPVMKKKLKNLLKELHKEFGMKSRISSLLGGRFLLWKAIREQKKLASGWTYEPPTFYEKNNAYEKTERTKEKSQAVTCEYIDLNCPVSSKKQRSIMSAISTDAQSG